MYSEEIAEMCHDIERHEDVKKEQQRDLDLFRSKKESAFEDEE